uniref:Death domain-containing protein n=1 Tax=Amphimedon queenslandica TaxID=400682 RepID=A0A1X7TGG8_AMPQE
MATKSSNYSSPPSLFSSPLTIDQLIDVVDLLERGGFPQTRWRALGLRLGLHKKTLDAIKRDNDTTDDCLTECLSQWLSRADSVDNKGGATFDSLSDALKSMNENAAADKLDQEKRNAMISGNDIKGTNDVHSTATGTNKPLIGGPPLSPIALMDIPDDRPTVSELVEFHELLIKGQLEKSLPLLDADTIRKIRNAATTDEGMSLLRQAFEEHPTLLHEMRAATEKIKGSSQKMPKSPPPVAPKPRRPSITNKPPPTAPKPKMKGSYVDPNLEQQPSVSEGPLQPVDVTAQSHTPQPTITGSQSSTPTTVIELSSKDEVAANIESLHSRFASLDSDIRDEFEELVEKGKVKLKAVARSAATFLDIPVSTLKYGDVDELFDSLKKYCDFFNCGVLKQLTKIYLSNAKTELAQYIDSVDKFSESSQLKNIRLAIEEKLSSLPAAASPTTSDQTKPFIIKLNGRWEEMTLKNFKRVLQYYFGQEIADICTIRDIGIGSVVATLIIPASLSQSLIDAINNKTNSMSRLGILEVDVDNKAILIGREDDNNFDVSLHESVKAGDSFEVSMLLQLGADPNSKDERGKSAVEIANEGGHTQIKEILLTGGGELFDTNINTHT